MFVMYYFSNEFPNLIFNLAKTIIFLAGGSAANLAILLLDVATFQTTLATLVFTHEVKLCLTWLVIQHKSDTLALEFSFVLSR